MYLDRLSEKFGNPFKRAQLVLYYTDTSSLIYHILIQIIFLRLKIYPMVFYNIISVTVFSLILLILKKAKSFIAAYFIGFTEIIIHQILANYFLGSITCFHYFILLMGFLPFFVFQKNQKLALPVALFSIIIFVVLENIDFPGKYPVSNVLLVIFKNINISLSVITILIIIVIFTALVIQAEDSLTKERNRLSNEINLAATIQRNFLKKDVSVYKDFEIECYNKPMVGVTGDIFDFYGDTEKLEGFSLFDVSGHGVSSGLITFLVKNIVSQEFSTPERTVWDSLNYINDRFISEKGNIDTYMTGILAKVNDNMLEISVAGHPAPILYNKKEDKCEYLKFKNHQSSAIGLTGYSAYYYSDNIEFNKGDELFLYTDGIIEMKNSEGRTFSNNELLSLFDNVCRKQLEEQSREISSCINAFIENTAQSDDLTYIIIRKK